MQFVTFTHDASGVKSTEVRLVQPYSKPLQFVTFTHDASEVKSTEVRLVHSYSKEEALVELVKT